MEWLLSDHLEVVLVDLPNPLDRAASRTPELAKDPRGEIQGTQATATESDSKPSSG